jgi:hypothetical protein
MASATATKPKRSDSKVAPDMSVAKRIVRQGIDLDAVVANVTALRGAKQSKARDRLAKLGYDAPTIDRMLAAATGD